MLCHAGASLENLDIQLFKKEYLPRAFSEDVLSEDNREIKQKLQSLGFYDLRFDCPTYAGIILGRGSFSWVYTICSIEGEDHGRKY
ncbi:MAG: hypothetical protein IPF54_05415 [Draconibacterium sp.]|nr:hypothetical protein [Draconibacterium sp.]